jgi:hypothetical protein
VIERNPRAEARYQKSRLVSSLVAIVTFCLFAGFAFDKDFLAAAVLAVLMALGTIAFAIMSWGRWVGALPELREATPLAPAASLGPGVEDENQNPTIPDDGQSGERPIDADLDALSREQLVEEVVKLRNAIRALSAVTRQPNA